MSPPDTTVANSSLLKACEAAWEEEWVSGTKNKNNCSGFLKSVAKKMGASLPDQQADGLVNYLKNNWTPVKSGSEARTKAVTGTLVVGGLKSDEQKKHPNQGHVAVVVGGALYREKYPKCWGGSTGSAQSKGTLSIGEVFAVADRDKVAYYEPKTTSQGAAKRSV